MMVVGICIPLISLCFMKGYNPNQNLFMNIYSLAIPLGQQVVEKSQVPEKEAPKGKVTWATLKGMIPRSIGFRFILAFGILLVFVGFIRFDAARQRARKDRAQHEDHEQGESSS
jgi:hypothetical protein